ncbi:MAG: FG-GAP-like repeat-containing protein [Bacteroidota bacterium]
MLRIIINLLGGDDINILSILHHQRLIRAIIFLCLIMPFTGYAQGIPNRFIEDDLVLPKKAAKQHLVKTSKTHLLKGMSLNKNVSNKLSSLAASSILWDDQLVNDDVSGVCLHENSGCAMDGSGNYTIVWGDYRTGNGDIYLQRYNSSGTTIGTNVRVNDDGQGVEHYYPAIASNSTGKTAVAWVDYRSGSADIYLQWFDASGSLNGTNIQVNNDAGKVYSTIHSVAVAVDGSGNTLVVWSEDSYLFLQRFNASGVAQGSNIQVNDDAGGSASHYRPAIGIDGSGNSAIVWQDNRNGNFDIYLQRYDGTGASLGVNIEVNDDGGTTNQYAPTIALNSSGAEVVTWYDLRNGNSDIYMQRYSAAGTAQGSNIMVNDDAGTASQYYPTVGIDLTGNSIIAWYDYRNVNIDIYLQRYNASGVAQGSNVKVNSNAVAANQYYPWVSINSNGVGVISWEDYRVVDGENIYHQRINTGGAFLGSNVKVNSDVNTASQWAPSVGMDGYNNSIIAWEDQRNGNYDIYMQRLNASGAVLGSNIKVNDDNLGAYHYFPFVAVNTNGRSVVVWKDSRNGSAYFDVYLQYYDASGSAIGSNVKVNDVSTSASPYDNCLTAAIDGSGNSVVVWEDDRNGSNYDIYMQLYNSSGTPLGSNIRVNDDAAYTYIHNQPSVGVDGSGNIIVTWYDNRDGNYHIYVQRYYAGGSPNGANIRVGDNVSSDQYSPTVAVTSSGASVIVWEDYRSYDDIYLQRFDASANPIGINTIVNDNVGTSARYWPSVVFDVNGNFLVAWQDYRNGQPDIVGQWYSATGIANSGNVLIVHDGVNHLETVPRLAASGQNLVCAWQDNRRSKGYDIYAKSFSSGWIGYSATTVPTITSFSPTSGPIGTTVTITGTNFDPTAANNIVYFGAVKAQVISSSPSALKVTVPVGATYQPITITVNGLTAYSNAPFIVTFVGGGAITSNSFSTKVDFTTGSYPFSVAIGDVDGDGKPDLVVTNAVSNSVSVFRNTGTSGTISFAAKVDFTTGLMPFGIAIVDVDGDGKLDLVVANYNSNTISVFRNTSTSGTISFATKVDFTTGLNPSSVAIGDVDGDGKPDLVVANYGSNTVSVFRNTSAIGSVSFAAKVDFTTGLEPQSVAVGDVDGDGKPDLAVVDSSSTVSVFRNTSAIGSVSFAASVDFTTGLGPSGVTIGDIDGDGRPDLAVVNYNSSTISVFRNTGTSGTISFAAKVDFTTGLNPSSVAIGDVDGDGKLDFAVANYNSSTISVFRNTGTIGSVSFADKIDFTTGTEPFIVAIGDVDGDGKPDFAVANFGSSTVSVFRNTILVDNTPPVFTVSPYTTGTPVLVDANGLVSTSPQVSASATDAGSGIWRMQVAYRNTSEQSWSYSQFVSATSISFSIPTNKFVYNNKPIGVNYQVGAWDNAGNVTWSPYNSIDVQLGPQVTDQPNFSMPAASQLSNKTTAYRMISVPYQLTNEQPANLLSNFGSHMENNISYARWRFQRYVNGQYQDYDQFSQTNAIIPGAAFFFIVRDQGTQIVVQGASVVRSDVMYNTGIQLQSGWNLVGNPFNIPYPIDSLVFYATASTVPQPIRQHAYYSGTGPIGGWDTASASVSQIQSWSGIAAYVNSAGTLKFPSAGQRSGLPKTSRVSSVPPIEKEAVGNWTLAFNAYRSDIDMRCEGSSLGMAQGANEGDDPYDSYIPPIVGDKNVAVYFKNADGAMMRDIRPLNEDGDVWEMRVVTGDAGVNVKLTLGDHLNLPNPSFEAYLIDIDQKMAHNLKEVQSLEINSGNGMRNFRVVVGKKTFVEGNNAGIALAPSSMKLYANYPNPFNPETVIRYTVPETSVSYKVTLKIFNVLGQEITTLVNEQKSSGYYEVKWNALKQSSGIYFYQLSITDGSKTFQDIKKMVLMK